MADEEEVEEGKSGPPIAMIGGIAVVMLVVGLGGGYFAAGMMGSAEAAETSEEGTGEEGEEGAMEGASERKVHPLESFMVNLRGGGGGRMLRLEVHLEIDAKHEEAIIAQDAVLRDAVLALASDQTYADLEGLDGKTFLRDELLRRLNAVLDGPRIERVYFTDFVVQ